MFKDDDITLTQLNLQTHYETVKNPETGEESRQAVTPSQATADVIARWRATVSGAQLLDAANKEILNATGWTDDRLKTALTLVEAFASADTAQRVAIQGFDHDSGWLRRSRI